MYTYNCKIETDSESYPAQDIVAATFSQKKTMSLLVRKFKQGLSGYFVEIKNQDRSVEFDSSLKQLEIRISTKEDLELLSATLSSAATVLEMLEDDQVAESIGVTIVGHRNKVDNIFDKNGEPLKEKSLLNKGLLPDFQTKERQQPFTSTFLRIGNLNHFLNEWQNNLDFYDSPFTMLAELEKKVQTFNEPETTILMPYSDNGDIIFDLIGVYYQKDSRILQYDYTTSVS